MKGSIELKRTLAGIVACLVVFTACRQETPDITFNTQAVDTSPVETSISYITDNAEGWLNAHTTAPPETEPEITETESEITDEELVSDAVKDGLSALSKKDRNAVYNAIDMDVLYYSEYGDMASVITDDFIYKLAENIKCKCFYKYFWFTYIANSIIIEDEIKLPIIILTKLSSLSIV